jgi:hypothetical protein
MRTLLNKYRVSHRRVYMSQTERRLLMATLSRSQRERRQKFTSFGFWIDAIDAMSLQLLEDMNDLILLKASMT